MTSAEYARAALPEVIRHWCKKGSEGLTEDCIYGIAEVAFDIGEAMKEEEAKRKARDVN
jgi:hypothetical protein